MSDSTVLELESIGSTNGEALRRARFAKKDEPLFAWIVAARQTQGRGRHGRHWHSPPGNLYATRLIRTWLPVDKVVGLTLVAGVAVHDAVAGLLGGPENSLELKWPNDLMADGAKMAGVLIQTEPGDTGLLVAIGIGVNVKSSPPSGPLATSMAALGWRGAPGDVFTALADSLDRWVEVWSNGNGFAAVRDAWCARSIPVGTSIRVRLPRETVHGAIEGLDETGSLIVRVAGGATRKITTGEVFTGAPSGIGRGVIQGSDLNLAAVGRKGMI